MFKCHGGRPLPEATKAQLEANVRIRCWLAPYRIPLGEPEPPDAPEVCACIDPAILKIVRALAEAAAAKDHARCEGNVRKKLLNLRKIEARNRDE
jgi:hypothetical protein